MSYVSMHIHHQQTNRNTKHFVFLKSQSIINYVNLTSQIALNLFIARKRVEKRRTIHNCFLVYRNLCVPENGCALIMRVYKH